MRVCGRSVASHHTGGIKNFILTILTCDSLGLTKHLKWHYKINIMWLQMGTRIFYAADYFQTFPLKLSEKMSPILLSELSQNIQLLSTLSKTECSSLKNHFTLFVWQGIRFKIWFSSIMVSQKLYCLG